MARCTKRFAFSLRSMLLAVTAVCLALATWTIGRENAVADVQAVTQGQAPEVVAPYVLRVTKSDNVTVRETYHLWCCGLIVRLPYSSSYPEAGGVVFGVRPRLIIAGEYPGYFAFAP